MSKSINSIAIVGSGFLGMTLALRLAQAGNDVTIFESADEIGGLASAWQIGEYTWDKHYHVTLLSDNFTRSLINELDLDGQFKWVETKTGFFTDGKLVSMSNTAEFLQFPPLDLISKVRLGITIFYASKVKNWKELEKISVADWLTRLSGKKTFEKIWKPLLKAKLGDAYKETSAAFIWATIQRMYAARRSGLKKEMFGYVEGGYAKVLQRFAKVLQEKGVKIRLGSRIEKISQMESGKWNVENTVKRDQGTESELAEKKVSEMAFDKVIITAPSNVAAEILPQLTETERVNLTSIKYQGIICASVLMKKPLSKYYVTNIIDESPFTGIIEMTALVDKRSFGGNALVYLPKYVSPDDPLFESSDAEIKENFLSSLEKMYPYFLRSDVVVFQISRVRHVFPLPVVDYSTKLPPINTSLDGVFVINSSHIVNGTLNVNETIALAEKSLDIIVSREK